MQLPNFRMYKKQCVTNNINYTLILSQVISTLTEIVHQPIVSHKHIEGILYTNIAIEYLVFINHEG